jgi:hypothetical protein
VQIHSWSAQLVADDVRAALGEVEFVCGFGIDSIARDVAKATITVTDGVRTMLRLAQRAGAQGLERRLDAGREGLGGAPAVALE